MQPKHFSVLYHTRLVLFMQKIATSVGCYPKLRGGSRAGSAEEADDDGGEEFVIAPCEGYYQNETNIQCLFVVQHLN